MIPERPNWEIPQPITSPTAARRQSGTPDAFPGRSGAGLGSQGRERKSNQAGRRIRHLIRGGMRVIPTNFRPLSRAARARRESKQRCRDSQVRRVVRAAVNGRASQDSHEVVSHPAQQMDDGREAGPEKGGMIQGRWSTSGVTFMENLEPPARATRPRD